MNDSFSDLWNVSTPSKAAPASTSGEVRKYGDPTRVHGVQYDSFTVLASASSMRRSGSGTPTNMPPPRPVSKQSYPSPPLHSTTTLEIKQKQDAFSSLLGTSFIAADKSRNMTIGDKRAAVLEAQQLKDINSKANKTGNGSDAVWKGIDMIGDIPSQVAPTLSSMTSDDWIFDSFTTAAPGSLNNPLESSSTQGTKLNSAEPLVDRTENSLHNSFSERLSLRNEAYTLNSDASGYPVVGDGANQLLVGGSVNGDDEADILGVLGKPVSTKGTYLAHRTSESRLRSHARDVSPPPHIIGQIVEMGFSPQHARMALASTDSGFDVQQALETLLSNSIETGTLTEPTLGESSTTGADITTEEAHIHERISTPLRAHVRHQPGDSSASMYSASHSRSEIPLATSGQLQDRADKLLAQASEIGANMFNRANAFWKEGKEKVQKAYEERTAPTKAKVVDGRPRWMQEASIEHDHGFETAAEHYDGGPRYDFQVGGFHDDSPTHLSRNTDDKVVPTLHRESHQIHLDRTGNLLDDEPAYVSPARRRKPVLVSPVSQPVSVPSLNIFQFGSTSNDGKSMLELRREVVTATASALATSNSYKTVGTEKYKLGQYADAEQAYSAAISALPLNHLLLIPLHNNRAITRLKIGDHSGAIDDCSAVINIIGLPYNPARETKVVNEIEGTSINFSDALLKAFRRRAEAYEGKEKWELARQDWEAIAKCDWSSTMRTDALNGLSRCRKLLTTNDDPPTSKAFIRTNLHRVSTPHDYEAVHRLRQTNRAQEEEDQRRYELKDAIDEKLSTWRKSKENNLRALIASLETVLWPELGWQKVGMHELVTPSQVKIRYMKAIAKLHPDKLTVNNTTLEQRMIANGVFSTLNDAWLAFKQ